MCLLEKPKLGEVQRLVKGKRLGENKKWENPSQPKGDDLTKLGKSRCSSSGLNGNDRGTQTSRKIHHSKLGLGRVTLNLALRRATQCFSAKIIFDSFAICKKVTDYFLGKQLFSK
jgi:hypothetical protein